MELGETLRKVEDRLEWRTIVARAPEAIMQTDGECTDYRDRDTL